MFYIDYVGPTSGVVAAVTAMTNSKGSGNHDFDLMQLSEALALSAAFYAPVPNTVGPNIHLQIRGGWSDEGTTKLEINIQYVALTTTGNVRVGDPTTRVAPW